MKRDKKRLALRAFLLLVAYYPLVNWTLRRLSTTLGSLWEDAALIAFMAIAVVLGWRGIKPLVTSSVFLAGVAYAAMTLFSYAANSYYVGAYIHEARLTFEPFMAFIIIVLLIEDDGATVLRWIAPHLVVCASLLALVGVSQYVRKVPIPAQWLDKDLETGVISTRAFSVFGSPNVLAAYLEVTLPLAVHLFLERRRPVERLCFGACSIAIGTGFLLTLTRASWLSAAGAFLAGLLVLKPVLAGVFAALGAGLLLAVPTFRLRMATLLSSTYIEKSNNLGRLFRWGQAFQNLSRHPWLGSGLGTFGGTAAQRFGYFSGISMDSVWVRVLAETGILGFVAFLVWIAAGFAGVAVRFFRSGDRLWLFTTIGLLALLINLFTDNLLNSWAIALLMWTLMALGVSTREST